MESVFIYYLCVSDGVNIYYTVGGKVKLWFPMTIALKKKIKKIKTGEKTDTSFGKIWLFHSTSLVLIIPVYCMPRSKKYKRNLVYPIESYNVLFTGYRG